MKTVCLTGVAGFIGFHLAKRLHLEGYKVIGMDNLNSYWDTKVKSIFKNWFTGTIPVGQPTILLDEPESGLSLMKEHRLVN